MLLDNVGIHVVDQFVEIPDAVPHLAAWSGLNKNPVTTTALPISLKIAAVRLEKYTVAVHLIMQELSLIALTILPP
jgi:hypothetical protein